MRTLATRGLDFGQVARLDFGALTVEPNERQDYGEGSIAAVGMIDGQLHVIAVTPRNADCGL